MPTDLRLKLLELTNLKAAVSLEDFSNMSKRGLDRTLAELQQSGLVTLANGFLTMNGLQRVALAEQLIHIGADPKKVSRLLGWREFEDFAERILLENGFVTRKHFTFKSSAGRREIDIFSWNDTFLLAVDCKHWRRGLSTGRMKEAAQAQVERVAALAQRPELLYRLKISRPESRSIVPVILTMGEAQKQLVDGVPVVSVPRLVNFIYELSPIDSKVQRIRVRNSMSQSRLEWRMSPED